MIITCPRCSTKFELEEKSISGKRARARCSKCRHVFELPASPDRNDAAERPAIVSARRAPPAGRPHRHILLRTLPVGIFLLAGIGLGAWGIWNPSISRKAEGLAAAGKRYLGLSGEGEGRMVLQNVKGYFVDNSHLNKVFIIEGQAVNHMKEPRSFLRVRGTLLDAKGAKVEEKMVYCGNILAEKDLKEMDREAIAKSLSSQFGESLSNLNVDPNQSVPFMIVFTDLPPSIPGNSSAPPGNTAEAAPSDFLVEVVGSQIGSK